jgi:hypothetical protein
VTRFRATFEKTGREDGQFEDVQSSGDLGPVIATTGPADAQDFKVEEGLREKLARLQRYLGTDSGQVLASQPWKSLERPLSQRLAFHEVRIQQEAGGRLEGIKNVVFHPVHLHEQTNGAIRNHSAIVTK